MQQERNRVINHSSTEIEVRFMKLMEQLWNYSANQLPEDEQDLTFSQHRLINFIGRYSGCHLQDIADGLQLTPPTVSVSIRKLEEGRWINRRPDPDDGRASCLYLTKKAEKAVEKAIADRQKFRSLFFAGLTEDEQQTLLELMEKGMESILSQIQK
jgi:DNA-binding MarR family transcriptional regulator